MEENLTKPDILNLVRGEFEALHATVRQIEPEDLLTPGAEGDWSGKDILCHLSAWRRLYVEWTQDLLEGKDPARPAPDESWETLDEFNESLFLAHRDTPLQETLDEFVEAHKDSLELIEELSETDLFDPDRFAWRKGDPLWHMVAGNTWQHDKEHHETIQRWVNRKGS